MSAISGLISLGQDRLSHSAILQFDNVMKAQKHRGPDATRFFAFDFDNNTIFSQDINQIDGMSCLKGIIGHNLLSVNNTKDCVQPYCTEDKTIGIAYDGQIVNISSIRHDLVAQGYSFTTPTDAEVLLTAYIAYGTEKMATLLNGVFVICLFDINKKMIHILGDRYGAKPLYYAEYDKKFLFASELKGLIQVEDFKRELDLDACNARLIFARTGSRVLLKGVKLLAPAEILTISPDGLYSDTYFSWDSYQRDDSLFKNDQEALAATEEVLEKVVARQIEPKRMGIQLSGGIDSTLTAHYAKKIDPENFSEAVGIVDGTGDAGEEYYIKYVANKLGLTLHTFQMTADYFVPSYEKMVWHNDAPVYRPYFSCFMRLGEMAKFHADVLFCGEGADEIAGGYSRFAGGALVPFLSNLNITNNAVKSYKSYAEYATLAGETITDFTTLGYKDTDKLLQERMAIFDGFKGTDFTKHLKFEIRECLPEASLRQDKMTMASSIQNRAPFLDNELVDLLMTMTEDYLVRFIDKSPLNLGNNPFTWMQGKWILKEIVAKRFGYDFAYRKKMIMNLDERGMVTDPRFIDYVHSQVLPAMKNRGLFDADAVQRMFDNAHSISSKEFTSMWKAISTETWCQLFIDKKAVDFNL